MSSDDQRLGIRLLGVDRPHRADDQDEDDCQHHRRGGRPDDLEPLVAVDLRGIRLDRQVAHESESAR